MSNELEFKEVTNNHGHAIFRAQVSGGWLYRHDNPISIDRSGGDGYRDTQWISTLCFVPEPPQEKSD